MYSNDRPQIVMPLRSLVRLVGWGVVTVALLVVLFVAAATDAEGDSSVPVGACDSAVVDER